MIALMTRHFHHLTEQDRLTIEFLVPMGYAMRAMALILGVATISREIEHGGGGERDWYMAVKGQRALGQAQERRRSATQARCRHPHARVGRRAR